jgi:hypothetical protein
MLFPEFFKTLRSSRHRLAWLVAIGADAVQIVLAPLFFEGAFSPVEIGLDAIVGVILSRLLGWHWAFLPTFAAELIPGFDLFPTWTAAVLFVTLQQVRSGKPEILPPGPAPAPRR